MRTGLVGYCCACDSGASARPASATKTAMSFMASVAREAPREEPRAELEILEPHRLFLHVAAVVVADEYHCRGNARLHEVLRVVAAAARDVHRGETQCFA